MKNQDQHKILISGDELMELKRHAHEIRECPGLDKRIQKYKGDKPFTFTLDELDWLVAVLDAVLNNPNGYALIEHNPWKLDYVRCSHPSAIVCKQLFDRLKKEAQTFFEATMNTREIELSEDEKDLLLKHKYYLDDDLLKKLKSAKENNGYHKIVITRYELEDMAGNMSMLTNHEEDPDMREGLNDLAEHLEVYL